MQNFSTLLITIAEQIIVKADHFKNPIEYQNFPMVKRGTKDKMLKCRGVGEERDNWDPLGGKDSLAIFSQVGQGFSDTKTG